MFPSYHKLLSISRKRRHHYVELVMFALHYQSCLFGNSNILVLYSIIRLRQICFPVGHSLQTRIRVSGNKLDTQRKQVHKSLNSPSSQSITAIGYLWEAYNHFITSYSNIEHRLPCLPLSHAVRYLFWKMSGIVRQQQKKDYGENLEKGGTFRLYYSSLLLCSSKCPGWPKLPYLW